MEPPVVGSGCIVTGGRKKYCNLQARWVLAAENRAGPADCAPVEMDASVHSDTDVDHHIFKSLKLLWIK